MENTFFALVREIPERPDNDLHHRYEALHGCWDYMKNAYVKVEVGVFDGVFMLRFNTYDDASWHLAKMIFDVEARKLDIENLDGFSIKKFITKTVTTIHEAKE